MKNNNNFKANLKHDLPAGLVVFLVALPLCLGIALASGAPLFSGIIAGIIGGTVVALISGSPLGVSGPAAGLAVIVLAAIQKLGSFEVFLTAVVLAGVIQIIFGFLRAGIIGYYFPSSVIKGMLSAIGIIIILKQIPHAFGYDKDFEGDLAFSQPDGHNTFSELLYMLDFITPGAMVITALSLGILILWEQKFIKQKKIFQLVQGPLVVVVLGIVLNQLFAAFSPALALNQEHLVSLPVPDSVKTFFGQFKTPDFTQILNPDVLLVAVTIAVVASLETLLCVEATDKLDPQKRVTPTNRELHAQGVGNLVSGLIGGLPITQVIVRSSANIQSGGKTKMASFFHGILLLISAMSIPFVLNMIPLASLAAVLLVVGYKLAKPALFKEMFQQGWLQFVPFVVTIVAIVFTDLLTGIGIGMAVAVFFILLNNYRVPYFFRREKNSDGEEIIKIKLSEDVSFLNKAGVLRMLENIPKGSTVEINAEHTMNMDYDVKEIIDNFKKSADFKDIKVILNGFDKEFKNPFRSLKEAGDDNEINVA